MLRNGVLAGKKTYVLAGVAVIGAVAGYLTGDLTTFQAIQTAGAALMGAAIRHGVSTGA